MAGTDLAEREEAAPPPLVAATAPLIGADEMMGTWRVAKALAASGMFKDATQADKAFAKILIGRDLGLTPTRSLMSIDLVEGAIQFRGVLLGSFLRKHPDYDYEIVYLNGEDPDESKQFCTLRFKRRDAATGEWEALEPDITYTVAMAKNLKSFKAGMPWFTARRNMLLWRAMSDGTKLHCPDIFDGIPVYVEGEIEEGARKVLGAGDDPAEEVAAEEVPWPAGPLGERLRKAVDKACEIEKNAYTPATLQMLLADQTPAELEKIAERIEKENTDRAPAEEEVADAEVVGAETPDEIADGAVEGLRARCEEIRAALERFDDPGEPEAQDLSDELEYVENQLRELGADVPGQEKFEI